MEAKKIEISHRTIIFIALFLIGLSVLWRIRSLIILFFISFILMEAANPIVTFLEKRRVPRILAIIIVYLIAIAFLGFSIASIIPILVDQSIALVNSIPQLVNNINIFGITAGEINTQLRILETLPQSIATITLGIFSNIFTFFVILVVTFYLLLERNNFGRYGINFFGSDISRKTLSTLDHLEKSLGSWVRAEALLMIIIGVMSYFGYLALGLSFAVPLAIIAGLLEIVPNIGPIIATSLAFIVGLSISPVTALLAVLWGIIVQQMENNFIVPKVMKDSIGINPLITILILAAGAQLGGVIGAILAVPVYLTIGEIFKTVTEIGDTKKPQRSR